MRKDFDEFRKIDNYLSRHQEAIDCVDRALEELSKAESLIKGIDEYALPHALSKENFYTMSRAKEGVSEKFKKRITVSLWKYLHRETGLYRLMDATATEEWDKMLKENPPPCTLENLEATFLQLREDKNLIFNRGVVNTFRKLDGNYRTNDAFKINKRIILEGCTNNHSRRQDEIYDIERIFYVMEGRSIPEYADSCRQVIDSHRCGNESVQGFVETEYMDMQFYLNGNCHVTFKRLDLIDQCNRIIAVFYGDNKLP